MGAGPDVSFASTKSGSGGGKRLSLSSAQIPDTLTRLFDSTDISPTTLRQQSSALITLDNSTARPLQSRVSRVLVEAGTSARVSVELLAFVHVSLDKFGAFFTQHAELLGNLAVRCLEASLESDAPLQLAKGAVELYARIHRLATLPAIVNTIRRLIVGATVLEPPVVSLPSLGIDAKRTATIVRLLEIWAAGIRFAPKGTDLSFQEFFTLFERVLHYAAPDDPSPTGSHNEGKGTRCGVRVLAAALGVIDEFSSAMGWHFVRHLPAVTARLTTLFESHMCEALVHTLTALQKEHGDRAQLARNLHIFWSALGTNWHQKNYAWKAARLVADLVGSPTAQAGALASIQTDAARKALAHRRTTAVYLVVLNGLLAANRPELPAPVQIVSTLCAEPALDPQSEQETSERRIGKALVSVLVRPRRLYSTFLPAIEIQAERETTQKVTESGGGEVRAPSNKETGQPEGKPHRNLFAEWAATFNSENASNVPNKKRGKGGDNDDDVIQIDDDEGDLEEEEEGKRASDNLDESTVMIAQQVKAAEKNLPSFIALQRSAEIEKEAAGKSKRAKKRMNASLKRLSAEQEGKKSRATDEVLQPAVKKIENGPKLSADMRKVIDELVLD